MLIAILSIANNAFSWGEVKKAKEFMQAGMYPQATELLDKKIKDKPTDAEAHFQLGICFINTGNYSGAEERFGSAVRLNSEYGYKIGGQYQKSGTENLNNGRIQRAIKLYKKAINYQPNLKKDIFDKCKEAGAVNLKKGNDNAAIDRFQMAIDINQSYRPVVVETFIDAAQNQQVDPNRQISLLRAAYDFSNSIEEAKVKKALKNLGEQFRKNHIKRTQVKKALARLSESYRVMFIDIIWPKVWKTILTKQVVGEGMDKKIHLLKHPTEVKNGDKIIIQGKIFKIFTDDWVNFKNKYEFKDIHSDNHTGWYSSFAPNGEILSVQVQRLVREE